MLVSLPMPSIQTDQSTVRCYRYNSKNVAKACDKKHFPQHKHTHIPSQHTWMWKLGQIPCGARKVFSRLCTRTMERRTLANKIFVSSKRVYRRGVFIFRRQIATTTTTTNALHNFVHIAVVTILLLPLLLVLLLLSFIIRQLPNIYTSHANIRLRDAHVRK